MLPETLAVAVIALAVGAVGGTLLGWAIRKPSPPVQVEAAPEDDTKPTLIPFRAPREVGRNLARVERNPPK